MLDSPEFLRGRNGEQIVARWLQERGWHIVPSYDYSGQLGDKAPRLQGAHVGYVIPDLDVAKDGMRFWAEVKLKKFPTLHRNTNTLEHGISLRLYKNYLRVQSITGTPVGVFVLEEADGFLLGASFEELGEPRYYDGDKMDRGGTVFWPREKFEVLDRILIPATPS